MDVYSLKNYLINNSEKIELILYTVGFSDVSDNFKMGDEYRCAWEEGTNPTSVRVNKLNLAASCFSHNINGDLITLVQAKLKCSFPETLKKIASIIDFTYKEEQSYVLPFGGFFKKIKKIREQSLTEMHTYDEGILDNYCIMPSRMFIEDGIDFHVQQKYKIGYDVQTDRIIVPWRTLGGEICGIMGRLNKEEIEKYENKWFPVIPFPKGKTLFAFSENYQNIQQHSLLLIGESEKFPMSLESKGVTVGIGLGGSNLTQFQANNIKSLFPKKILVMLDEGLDEEHSRHMAEQLKVNSFYENQVGYVYDKHNLFLPKDSKLSPSDLPLEDMKRLMKHCTISV